ncbi:MAG TPA: universal stress protein [Propionibacteriaceae bacterium]
MSSILVGLDLSPSGRAALQWAAQQARLTARKLVAINAVPIPPGLAPIGVLAMPETGMDESMIDPAYREAIHAVWESVLPEPGWALEFVLDDAGPALVRRSAEATLLVVGTHEHVGLARLVSGSVSRYCLSHAQCPIVIMPVDNRAVFGAYGATVGGDAGLKVLPVSLRTPQVEWPNKTRNH